MSYSPIALAVQKAVLHFDLGDRDYRGEYIEQVKIRRLYMKYAGTDTPVLYHGVEFALKDVIWLVRYDQWFLKWSLNNDLGNIDEEIEKYKYLDWWRIAIDHAPAFKDKQLYVDNYRNISKPYSAFMPVCKHPENLVYKRWHGQLLAFLPGIADPVAIVRGFTFKIPGNRIVKYEED